MDDLNGKEDKELTEVEQWDVERKMMEQAYQNSYKVLTDKVTFKELMAGSHKTGNSTIMAHDPHEGINDREKGVILNFFEVREEYEKCAELKASFDGVKEIHDVKKKI